MVRRRLLTRRLSRRRGLWRFSGWVHNDGLGRLGRLAVPLGVAEVLVRFDKIVDGERVLALKQPRSPPDDLLEFDHRVNGPHQDDVADIAGIHAGGEFL